MTRYLVIVPGKSFDRDFPDLRAAQQYVEGIANLKTGWRGEWKADTLPGKFHTWVFSIRDAKGRLRSDFYALHK